PVGFRALHPLRRVAIVVGSWAVPALFACVLLGPARAARHLQSALPQLARAIDTSAAVRLLEAFFALPWPTALGVFLMKVVAFNVLVPVPTQAGGQIVLPLSSLISARLEQSRLLRGVLSLAQIPCAAVAALWIWALYRASR